MSRLAYQRAYRRNLPHFQPRGGVFFVTFRLDGSLPQQAVSQWNLERQWLAHLARTNVTHYERLKGDFERTWFRKFESLLDGATTGPVWLRDKRIASTVAESLHHRHGKAYRLDAFTIMPNHVHVVVKPLPRSGRWKQRVTDGRRLEGDEYQSLSSIMQSLKGYTAFEANRILGRRGEFWAHESYDHWIRDYDEWQRIVAYVLNNPLKAGYVQRWQDWEWNYRRV